MVPDDRKGKTICPTLLIETTGGQEAGVDRSVVRRRTIETAAGDKDMGQRGSILHLAPPRTTRATPRAPVLMKGEESDTTGLQKLEIARSCL